MSDRETLTTRRESKIEAYLRQAAEARRAIEASPRWLRDTAVPPKRRRS